MMTNDLNDTDKIGILIGEGRHFRHRSPPPDVNESGVFFTPVGTAGKAGRSASASPPSKTSGRRPWKAFSQRGKREIRVAR